MKRGFIILSNLTPQQKRGWRIFYCWGVPIIRTLIGSAPVISYWDLLPNLEYIPAMVITIIFYADAFIQFWSNIINKMLQRKTIMVTWSFLIWSTLLLIMSIFVSSSIFYCKIYSDGHAKTIIIPLIIICVIHRGLIYWTSNNSDKFILEDWNPQSPGKKIDNKK